MKEENELKMFLFYLQMCLLTTLKEVVKVQNPVHSGTHTHEPRYTVGDTDNGLIGWSIEN